MTAEAMRTWSAPGFWWHAPPGAVAQVLSPLGTLYGAAALRRMARPGARCGVPIVCVGNFVAGGAGKTPVALALGRLLRAQGDMPVFLSRGYGGATHRVPVVVDRSRHGAAEVGDEALLLARVATTVVAADRMAAAQVARATGAGILILDDGLQSAGLVHDLRLAVVDGATGCGNGLCLPAGPLRAPLEAQMRGISAVVIVGSGPAGETVADAARAARKPVLRAHIVPDREMAARLDGRRVVAFAGIGAPPKFFATLAEIGADIVGRRGFPDHHVYRRRQLIGLQQEAVRKDAVLVTTEKDFVRFAPMLASLPNDLPAPVALPITLVFEDVLALHNLVDPLGKTRPLTPAA